MAIKKGSSKKTTPKDNKNPAAKTEGQEGGAFRKILFTLVILLAIVFCSLVVWLVCMIPGQLMYENPRFKLRRIEVKSSGYWHGKGDKLLSRLAPEVVLDTNIFCLNAGEIRKKLLAVPSIEEAEVQFVLPDMVVFNIRERIPRAEVGGGAVIDENGKIFKRSESSAANRTLPRLIISNPDKNLQKEAIQLITTATRECKHIVIESVKIESAFCLEVQLITLLHGNQRWKVLFPVGTESYSTLFDKLQSAILHTYLKRDNPVGFDLRFKTYAAPLYQ